jgi:hypothetical protein
MTTTIILRPLPKLHLRRMQPNCLLRDSSLHSPHLIGDQVAQQSNRDRSIVRSPTNRSNQSRSFHAARFSAVSVFDLCFSWFHYRKDQIEFAAMPVADALGWFSTNPEFVEMVETNDAKFMRYIREKQNVVQLLECINNPAPTEEYKHRMDAIPALAVFILTAPTNAGFLKEIAQTSSLLDVFFESTLRSTTLVR